MSIPIIDAVISLSPDSLLEIVGEQVYANIKWLDDLKTHPTESEINAELTRLQTEYDTQEYARNRKIEYDALNQLELISDDAINSTTTLADAISSIKTKWPKDNSGPIE
jgi:glutamyl-tRNA reductase